MSYPLRLPEALDLEARKRCERLGISLNSLICVALDAYLSPAPGPARQGKERPPEDPGRSALAEVTESADYRRYVKLQRPDGTPLSAEEIKELDREVAREEDELGAGDPIGDAVDEFLSSEKRLKRRRAAVK